MKQQTLLAILFLLLFVAHGCAQKTPDGKIIPTGWDLYDAYKTCTTNECFAEYIRVGDERSAFNSDLTGIIKRRERIVKADDRHENGKHIVKYVQRNDAGYCGLTLTYDQEGTVIDVMVTGTCNYLQKSALATAREQAAAQKK